MANNIVAYVGLESFDTILYLSRIMQRLGRKVLVVDNSDTLSLTYSVPQISDINTNQTIISNRRVDFTNMSVSEELAAEYDDILIDCGMKEPITTINLLTRIVYVTDLFDYNIRRLAGISQYYNSSCDKELLIRNAVFIKISPEQISQKISKVILPDRLQVLYRDELDYESALNCHINQVFAINVSRGYKKYLLNQVKIMCDTFTSKEIKEAFREAKNGD